MFDASNMLAALLNPNPLLVATFFTILFLVFLNMALGIRADMRDNAAAWTHVEVAKMRRSSNTKSLKKVEMEQLRIETGVAETAEMAAKIEATRTVANYAETSLPDFVNDRSLCHSFGRAIVENHEWVAASAWGAYDPIVPKYIRAQVELKDFLSFFVLLLRSSSSFFVFVLLLRACPAARRRRCSARPA